MRSQKRIYGRNVIWWWPIRNGIITRLGRWLEDETHHRAGDRHFRQAAIMWRKTLYAPGRRCDEMWAGAYFPCRNTPAGSIEYRTLTGGEILSRMLAAVAGLFAERGADSMLALIRKNNTRVPGYENRSVYGLHALTAPDEVLKRYGPGAAKAPLPAHRDFCKFFGDE